MLGTKKITFDDVSCLFTFTYSFSLVKTPAIITDMTSPMHSEVVRYKIWSFIAKLSTANIAAGHKGHCPLVKIISDQKGQMVILLPEGNIIEGNIIPWEGMDALEGNVLRYQFPAMFQMFFLCSKERIFNMCFCYIQISIMSKMSIMPNCPIV